MIKIISKLIHEKRFKVVSRGSFFLVSSGLVKFLINKQLFKKLCNQKSIYKIFNIATEHKRLIIFRE